MHANVVELRLDRTVAGGHLAHLHEWKESIALAIANLTEQARTFGGLLQVLHISAKQTR